LLSILSGLASAVSWGAADFSGGIISKRSNVFGVVITAQGLGMLLFTVLALVNGEPFPDHASLWWSGAAGLCYGFCLPLFYTLLARGRMSVAAPVSAVMAAVVPMVVGLFTEGFPGMWTFTGILLALAAVWLIARGEGGTTTREVRLNDVVLPLLAGMVFGMYFVSMHHASREAFYWPVALARLVSISVLLVYALATRQNWLPQARNFPLIALSGLLDVGGNAFYILSGQLGRLDTAAVLGSLYPGSTVLLAALFLHERLSGWQKAGVLTALAAILLMTL
jgi:drug/metabolite transporter (DMT)-like permease